jgi:hypothetical protein
LKSLLAGKKPRRSKVIKKKRRPKPPFPHSNIKGEI